MLLTPTHCSIIVVPLSLLYDIVCHFRALYYTLSAIMKEWKSGRVGVQTTGFPLYSSSWQIENHLSASCQIKQQPVFTACLITFSQLTEIRATLHGPDGHSGANIGGRVPHRILK